MWAPYKNHLNRSDQQKKIIEISAPHITSFDYKRISINSIEIIAVDETNSDTIYSKIINFEDLNYLKTGTAKDLDNGCSTLESYAKNRCTGCRYGAVIDYDLSGSTISNVECKNEETGIDDFKLDQRRIQSVSDCFNDAARCGLCTNNINCLSCQGDLLMDNGFCIEKCPFGLLIEGNNC